jgi:hypothetical protein
MYKDTISKRLSINIGTIQTDEIKAIFLNKKAEEFFVLKTEDTNIGAINKGMLCAIASQKL